MAPATEETKPVEKPKPAAVKPNPDSGKVVEEIIARVNNEIITRSEYDKSLATADEEVKQDCQGKCTPEQLQDAMTERKKTALRDLIDQSLLAQRGKDMGLSVETDVVKQLDQIRQQNKLSSMDDCRRSPARA
jgi:peptidyl-prolyl cis-trans isomerase SurA